MNVIVAVDRNWAIGKDGDQLVYIPADLKHFKALTTGHPAILGRKTLATFPGGKPLKGRLNLILSRNPDFAPEGEFDQVDRVLYDLKRNPASRRIMTNLYNHHDLHEMALYPCAYSMTFNVSGKTLNAILNQRSQDMLTANGWNVMQYAALVHMLAQVSGLEAGELVHVIADAHIYDRHVPVVEEIISRTPYEAPKLWMDPNITDFYAFTKDSFKLEGYQFHTLDQPIPVAI